MSKFVCRCGQVLTLSEGWSDDELLLIPERTIEEVSDKIESGALHSSEDFYAQIDRVKLSVYRCLNCGRLHVQTSPGIFTSYAKE